MFTIYLLLIIAALSNAEECSSPWHYECKGGYCRKTEMSPNITSPLSLDVCQLFCGETGALWPKPTGHMSLGNFLVTLDANLLTLSGVKLKSKSGALLQKNVELLKDRFRSLGTSKVIDGVQMIIHISDRIDSSNVKLSLSTDEGYILHIQQLDDGRVNASIDARSYYGVNASIDARSYFGARHAMETLSQLTVFDDVKRKLQVVRDVYIVDSPVYPYRGILLDTARNFVDKDTILRTIKGMSMTKMNTFHWHITDTHSFPYVSRTWPKFSKYGAITPRKVYTHEDVKEIVDFGLVHGVRVLPEFDAPAHVGEGWQWVGNDTVLCFKAEPWTTYCVEPPCGQLNPSSDRVYEILQGIYTDMVNDFNPDIFHMGGDEVNIACWQSSSQLKTWMTSKGWNTTEADFYKAWDYFQAKALEKFVIANNGKEVPIVLWTSGLTSEDNIQYLDPKKYIIQIWTTGEDATIARLFSNNFKVIFSNYDALYFDCGFGAWVGEGNNWCSPYKGWQLVYDNSPLAILLKQGFTAEKKNLILGGEATLWTEQADSASIDSRLWPRAAALGERLWAEPSSSWIHAEQRMLRHRERMIQQGIQADSLQPEWCMQNQGYCYL